MCDVEAEYLEWRNAQRLAGMAEQTRVETVGAGRLRSPDGRRRHLAGVLYPLHVGLAGGYRDGEADPPLGLP